MNRRTVLHLAIAGACGLAAPCALAEIRLPRLFADHMVLQQGQEVSVWGQGEPGETVTVTFADRKAEAKADPHGAWKTRLPALEGGQTGSLTVAGSVSTNRVSFGDVAVGEVWICSGQSNMAHSVANSRDAQKEIAAADHPEIRLFRVPGKGAGSPVTDVDATWTVCSPETVQGFSGAAYFFGRELSRKLHVPVGLIQSAVGGTCAESWTPQAILKANPRLAYLLGQRQRVKKLGDDEIKAAAAKIEADWAVKTEPLFAQATQPDPAWFDPGAPVTGWASVKPESNVDRQLGQDVEGSFWLRKTFEVPAEHAGSEAAVHLGALDDYDFTWVNGKPVGQTGRETADSWKVPRDYTIPAGTLRSGTNVIVIRLIDVFGGTGFNGRRDDDPLRVKTASGYEVSLNTPWLARLETSIGSKPPIPINRWGDQAGALYDGMIAPLIAYGFRGAIWYQGESNASRAVQYRELFPTLIQSWRTAAGREFPFYYVQLANFMKPRPVPGESEWAELREAQSQALRLPKTGMAVIVDTGESEDIHPVDKQDVGERLARIALAKTYGQPVPYSGPAYKSKVVKGNRIGLKFSHATGGLVAHPVPAAYNVRVSKEKTAPLVRNSPKSELEGFAVCGKDRKWVWADAKIENGRVWVWSEQVPEPVAVRYDWADNPFGNLYNRAGLPASPFRTDDFEALTAHGR